MLNKLCDTLARLGKPVPWFSYAGAMLMLEHADCLPGLLDVQRAGGEDVQEEPGSLLKERGCLCGGSLDTRGAEGFQGW